jgi:hypothetical protein
LKALREKKEIEHKMTELLSSILPKEIVDHVKLYTGEAYWTNQGKFRLVSRFPKDDHRYEMLRKRPRVKQILNENYNDHLRGCAWFKREDGRFVVINVRYMCNRSVLGPREGYFWEMFNGDEKTTVYLR